jgi:acetate kinase
MTKYTRAYASVLGGLDTFVFTAGIGEPPPLRAALCHKLGWLGVKLDHRRTLRAARAFPLQTAACRCGHPYQRGNFWGRWMRIRPSKRSASMAPT